MDFISLERKTVMSKSPSTNLNKRALNKAGFSDTSSLMSMIEINSRAPNSEDFE